MFPKTVGESQTRSKMHSVYGGYPYPKFSERSRGSSVRVDGHTYIDWQAALASVGLGYGAVDEAIIKMITDVGITHPMPTRFEGEVAEQLMEAIGFGEQVRWVKTGSEATVAAMQIAKAHTKRDKIVSIGYHGWSLSHLPSTNLIDVPWGSEYFYDEIDYSTAAVLLEPFRDHLVTEDGAPVEQYIQRVQNWCHKVGALLVLDEMVMGFRLAIGGAGQYFRIKPDLACYGKAMANGAALACVVGPRKLMRYAHDVSSTFGGECVGLAAAKATIEVYQREPVIAWMWQVGKRLKAAIPQLSGWPVHPWLALSETQRIEVVQACAHEGILMHPAGMNPMYAHSDADVTRTIEVLAKALESVSKGTVGA